MPYTTHLYACAHAYARRVEGQGAAVITDVIYSSDTTETGKGVASSGSKEEYEGLRAEIQEKEKCRCNQEHLSL